MCLFVDSLALWLKTFDFAIARAQVCKGMGGWKRDNAIEICSWWHRGENKQATHRYREGSITQRMHAWDAPPDAIGRWPMVHFWNNSISVSKVLRLIFLGAMGCCPNKLHCLATICTWLYAIGYEPHKALGRQKVILKLDYFSIMTRADPRPSIVG